jgi:type II secretory pathway pseudopilin PulG
MAYTIWSVIAVLGGLATIAVILWFLVTGRGDRDKEEDARRYFDEHGRWPDESPSP